MMLEKIFSTNSSGFDFPKKRKLSSNAMNMVKVEKSKAMPFDRRFVYMSKSERKYRDVSTSYSVSGHVFSNRVILR